MEIMKKSALAIGMASLLGIAFSQAVLLLNNPVLCNQVYGFSFFGVVVGVVLFVISEIIRKRKQKRYL